MTTTSPWPVDGASQNFAAPTPIVTPPSNPNPVAAPAAKRTAGTPISPVESRMLQARLGQITSLFLALRAKHPPTATHCLRVALTCSSWGLRLRLPTNRLDTLEIAALLHDLGKIGVPDRVLQKPMRLSEDERLIVMTHPQIGAEILRGCGVSDELLQVIDQATSSLDGSNQGVHYTSMRSAEARMLAIVDAYDSMTTDHVYRRAMSMERALSELCAGAGTQFDPDLVKDFAQFIVAPGDAIDKATTRRWLHELSQENGTALWQNDSPMAVLTTSANRPIEEIFHRRLLDYMHDGVIFVDRDQRVLEWNRAAERLTGISQAAVLHQQWCPEMIGLLDENGIAIGQDRCPVAETTESGMQTLRRLKLQNRDGKPLLIDAHLLPVYDRQRTICGATLMFRDISQQASLEERVQTLHEKATKDPLTGSSNRAEFNSELTEFLHEHLSTNQPGSMIMCDIDFFKRINDTYGHQAGDEALKVFAAVLRESARGTDMVARYGGEEFVILCNGCDMMTAFSRAEEIRRILQSKPMAALKHACLTASFGVTECQLGDTEETFLARADRALMMAKEQGRNRVIQLGAGCSQEETVEESGEASATWFSWFSQGRKDLELHRELISSVPVDLAVEKLRGFVSDHNAQIVHIKDGQVLLRVAAATPSNLRRRGDRPTPMFLEVAISEVQVSFGVSRPSLCVRTLLDTKVRPVRSRDRRSENVEVQAKGLFKSFESYMMAQMVTDDLKERIIYPPKPDGR